jgi:predicted MFS family arabinose efflux permease
VIAPLASGVALLAAFVLVEGRIARVPLVPLSIFRNRGLRSANLVVVLLYASFFPVWYFLTLFLQQVEGHGAIATGIGFLPMTLAIFAASSLSPRLVARFGPRQVITAGMLLATAGLVVLTLIAPGQSYAGPVLVGGFLSALGMGMSLVPATIVATQGVERARSGLASGLLNTSRLVGGALGLAILSTIATAHTDGQLAAGIDPAQALTDGFSVALAVGAAISLVGALAAGLLLRPREAHAPAIAPAVTEESERLVA